MINIQQNISLLPYNTFKLGAKASYFCHVTTLNDLTELMKSSVYQNEKHLILGSGSNLLFRSDFNGLIIKVDIKGKEIISKSSDKISVKFGAGELWHDVVNYCTGLNYGGIENLALIPGTMGAAPIQNIGAYGEEIKNVIENVEGVDLKNDQLKTFQTSECLFGYRESIFKGTLKEKYFISSVTLSLTTKNHILNTSYGAIKDTLQVMNVTHPTIQTVRDAVIKIRSEKLPDPSVIGNAGSFFKNPVIPVDQYKLLKNSYASLPSYTIDNQYIKVPAGWLIEQCGWKGKKINSVGVYPFQSLVIVNYGNANGEEIFQLAMKIKSDVEEKFHITLTPEVNII